MFSRAQRQACQPGAGCARRAQAHRAQVRVRRRCQQRGVFSPPQPVGAQRPQKDRVAAEEVRAQAALAITIPKHLVGCHTPKRPQRQAPHDQRQPIIKPHDRVGATPDQVAHFGVVAIHHPGIATQRGASTLLEDSSRRWRPAGIPVQRIQLNVRQP
jgi:hypothetical protein